MPEPPNSVVVGRAAAATPPNRFEAIHVEADFEQLAGDDELLAPERRIKTEFYADASQSLITSNDSPDVPFRYSVNPYRGCEHGWLCSSILPPCNLSRIAAFRLRGFAIFGQSKVA